MSDESNKLSDDDRIRKQEKRSIFFWELFINHPWMQTQFAEFVNQPCQIIISFPVAMSLCAQGSGVFGAVTIGAAHRSQSLVVRIGKKYVLVVGALESW